MTEIIAPITIPPVVIINAPITILSSALPPEGGSETLLTMGELIDSSGVIATPSDADKFPLRDSASGLLAHMTGSGIKAWLKGYFDTLYVTAATVSSAISSALSTLKTILGQYDTRTDLTATNGATVTLNYALGNAFIIDASALAAGNSFTIVVSNWPSGAVFSALELILTTGANIPTISWPTGVTGPTLQASKDHWYTMATRNNGTTTRLFSAGVF